MSLQLWILGIHVQDVCSRLKDIYKETSQLHDMHYPCSGRKKMCCFCASVDELMAAFKRSVIIQPQKGEVVVQKQGLENQCFIEITFRENRKEFRSL